MKRTILIAALLMTAACAQAPAQQTQPPEQPINAVFMPDTVDEPEYVTPSNQALFVAEHPDASKCDSPDELYERLKSEGATQVSDDIDKQVWMAKDGAKVFVEVSPMEACIVESAK